MISDCICTGARRSPSVILGQLALSFVGYRAIRDARVSPERRLGVGFSAPDFHREVLRGGSAMLASLQAKLAQRVAEQLARRR